MLNKNLNQSSCTVAIPSRCNHTTQEEHHITTNATAMQLSEPLSLKQLAEQVLARQQCNSPCNSNATGQKMLCNFNLQNNSQKLHTNYNDKVVDIASKYQLTTTELIQLAAKDWPEISKDEKRLHAFADAITRRKLMEQGIVPDDFTATTYCKSCGLVPVHPAIANNGQVLGCPWCWNKAYGYSIPNIEQ